MDSENSYHHTFQEYPLQIDNVAFTLLHDKPAEIRPLSRDQHTITIHAHFYYELFYARKDFTVLISGKEIDLKQGQLLLVSPNAYHTGKYAETSAFFALCFLFKINKDKEDLTLYNELQQLFAQEEYTLFDKNDQLISVMESIISYDASGSSDSKHLICARFYELIFLLKEYRRNASKQTVAACKWGSRPDFDINGYIGSHLKDPNLSLEKVAQKVNLSSKQIGRIIKQKTGLTFRQYLISLRMQNATYLLAESRLKIKDISDAVGYNSVHVFYAAFRKVHGCTPE